MAIRSFVSQSARFRGPDAVSANSQAGVQGGTGETTSVAAVDSYDEGIGRGGGSVGTQSGAAFRSRWMGGMDRRVMGTTSPP